MRRTSAGVLLFVWWLQQENHPKPTAVTLNAEKTAVLSLTDEQPASQGMTVAGFFFN